MKKIIIIIFTITLLFILINLCLNKNKRNTLNEFEKYNNYKKNNLNRYIYYEKTNKNKTKKEIILEVNIGLDKPFYSNTHPSKYLNTDFILVNKYNYLDESYIPKNLVIINSSIYLVKNAYINFILMKDEAKKNDLNIVGISGYRDYSYQKKLYNRYVLIDGIKKADTYSARPGYSEHQTGLSIDISNGKTSYDNFHNTKEFIWMKDNAYKYGFILRYPKEKENITGYSYESWHYRYVGIKISTYIYKNNITFDEYYYSFIE